MHLTITTMWTTGLLDELRFGARSLARRPGFTITVLAALSLGIGATTAMFSVINRLMLRPLPFPGGDRLVVVWESNAAVGTQRTGPSGPNFLDWRDQNTSFEEMLLFEAGSGTLTGLGEPEQIPGIRVTTNFLSMLGARLHMGRGFRPEEGRGERQSRAVLSYGFWQRRLGGDPEILGRRMTIDGIPYEVVGITASDFWFPVPADAFVPWNEDGLRRMRRAERELGVLARLRPTVTIEQAQEEMNTIAARIAERYPEQRGWTPTIVPMLEAGTQGLRPAALVLFGAVAFVLLIACANLASLLVARTIERHREVAIRLATGASRWHVLRLFLSEGLLLAAGGCVLGLLASVWLIDLIRGMLPERIPLPHGSGEILLPSFAPDGTVLAFALSISLITGVVISIVPALQAGREDLASALSAGARGLGGVRSAQTLRSLLVGVEIALAVVMLTGTALMLASFWKLHQVQPGFRSDGVLCLEMELPTDTKYKGTRLQAEFYRQVLARLQVTPGIEAAGLAEVLPLDSEERRRQFTIAGRPLAGDGQAMGADYNAASPGFFTTFGIPLLRGRMFAATDNLDAPPVILVDSTLAQRYFPNEDPVGRRLVISEREQEIIGVAGAIRKAGLEKEPQPTVYYHYLTSPDNRMGLVIRGRGTPESWIRPVKEAVWSVDKDQPVFRIRTMQDAISGATSIPRLVLWMLGAFGGVALLMAAVGIYGVIAYNVSRRRQEIGLRQALGASSRDVVKLILHGGFRVALAGLAVGLAASVVMTRALSTLLYEVNTTDPVVLAAVSFLLLTVALAASYLPARRAARLDPMEALRCE